MNEAQLAAARCPDGPNLILAGPGTGKTTTLVARYQQLVARGVPAAAIMAVTFTAKAADELKSRLQASLGAVKGRSRDQAGGSVPTPGTSAGSMRRWRRQPLARSQLRGGATSRAPVPRAPGGSRDQPSNQKPEEASSSRSEGACPVRCFQCLRAFRST